MEATKKTITLQLSLDQVNVILSGLAKLPFESVFQDINEIQRQAQFQLKQQAEAESEQIVEKDAPKKKK